MTEWQQIRITVNGETHTCAVAARQHLVDFLRDRLGLTGTHLGCEHGACGACTVRLDGHTVRGCLVLAVQADGARVQTVEGLSDSGELRALQEAFVARNAFQCGYCTPGMLLTAAEFVAEQPNATREQVRLAISGNYCRCTGYHSIVDAVCDVLARDRRAPAGSATAGTES
jgi:carbon-monoxide dehydrogenase small subunit